jgi:hypothetical protein
MDSISDEIAALQTEIQSRFAEFNKLNPASSKRRYPRELKELIGRARVKGVRSAVLCRLSGLSSSAVHRYSKTSEPKPLRPRRLTIVDTKVTRSVSAPVVIRLSSGVVIELRDGDELSFNLLKTLSHLGSGEVRDAAAR